MARTPKLSAGRAKYSLPVLDVSIPPMPGNGSGGQKRTHVFNVGQAPQKYTVDDLKKQSSINSNRTVFFEKTLLGIWLATGKRPVPYAFTTAGDGKLRSLDAGCLGYLMNRDPPLLEVAERDEFECIKSVSPTAALRSKYVGLSDENLRGRIKVTAAAASKEELIAPIEAIEKLGLEADEAEVSLGFDPFADVDERVKRESLQVLREGQREFTKAMRANWGGTCPVTQTTVNAVLDGAHIYPYGGKATNDHRNGLLLRADIHRLFDNFLVSFSYDGRDLVFHVANSLKAGEYGKYDGLRIERTALPKSAPHKDVLKYHHVKFSSRNSN